MLIFGSRPAWAQTKITTEQAVQCILGEVRGEYAKYGQESFDALASALRNRGHLGGVYGCKANFTKEIPYLKAKGLYESAKKAWLQSANSDFVAGAQYWGSTIVDLKWIAEMESKGFKLTKIVGKTAYYKED
jgi:hypothetical protein